MSAYRLIGAVALVGLLSGCAGGRARTDMARLQSQVGLLEERVGQLERTGMSTASTDAWGGTAASSDAAYTTPAPASSSTSQTSTAASTAPSAREIQQALKNAGFYQGPVDGKVGPQTRDAIREFQRVHGLVDDGKVGRRTWTKLSSYLDLSSSGSGSSSISLK